ncbi:hypothetical protein E2C01_078904 [Portunus trituberculatus]|uniref:Transposase Tc1-like domain-containing protein n=1 Tax=Portunus trituberculatus TaxID=210409 RepID=A0A5B7IRD0_PORTR|nr:hypothetical protein [Portunus trituberculatus]
MSVLVRKWRSEGCKNVPLHKHGGGPAKKVSDNTLSVIKWELNKNPSITAKQLKEQNPLLLKNVSIRTIQRNIQKKLDYRKLRAHKKTFVTEKQRKMRFAFARSHKDWDLMEWRKELWTDEATFSIKELKCGVLVTRQLVTRALL